MLKTSLFPRFFLGAAIRIGYGCKFAKYYDRLNHWVLIIAESKQVSVINTDARVLCKRGQTLTQNNKNIMHHLSELVEEFSTLKLKKPGYHFLYADSKNQELNSF